MSEQEMYEDIASVDEIAEEETLDFDADLSEADDKGVETEKASVNSVAAAAKKTKKAKVPGGEKSKGDQKADTISGTKAKVEEDVDVEDDDTVDFSEDLDALVESEATLSEGFREKAAVIFEAAINSKVSAEVSRIEESLQEKFNAELEESRDDMVTQIDGYLDYVVEKFVEENQLSIENGIRTEIAEDFMNGLKNLFAESYIEVPESKVDLVDELAEQVNDLEDRLNETTETAIEQSKELETFKRDFIIREHSKGLAETQVEKLKSLVEDIDFEDDDTFSEKVSTIKESYFTKKRVNVIGEDLDEASIDEEEVSGSMARYVTALRTTHKPK